MSKTNKAVERVKTALIVLLTISALLLGWQTGLYHDVANSIPFIGSFADFVMGSSGAEISSGTQIREAARPMCIVITSKDGGRFGARYDTDARNAAYDRVISIVGETLGSAARPTEVGEDEWRNALSGPGVYFEYYMPVKLSILDGWIDARMPDTTEDALVRRLVVAIGEDRSRLYYQDDESGLFYGADTASAAGKAQELDVFSANGAIFAFETGTTGAGNAPYVLITGERDFPNLRASAAGSAEELLEISVSALGHGHETHTVFQEMDGTRWVGTQFNIIVDSFGRVLYRNSDVPRQGEWQSAPGEGQSIELARMLVAETIGAVCGDAEVFYDSSEYGARGSISVYFTYFAAVGCVVLSDDEYAAKITLVAGVVTEAELNYRNFTFDGEYTRLLPEIQTLAAAGGEFTLFYSDTGAERIQPSWGLR